MESSHLVFDQKLSPPHLALPVGSSSRIRAFVFIKMYQNIMRCAADTEQRLTSLMSEQVCAVRTAYIDTTHTDPCATEASIRKLSQLLSPDAG